MAVQTTPEGIAGLRWAGTVASVRQQRSRGASSTEYALLIAVLGGVLCLGIATVAKVVVGHSFCTLGQALGVDLCAGGGGSAGSGQPDDVPTGEPSSGGTQPQPGPSPTRACAEPTPTPTSASPTPSPSCSTA
jgi:Flp pilus assembly pilin Flp